MTEPYLERLQCLECGYIIATVTEYEGRTAIQIVTDDATEVIVFRAAIKCPNCWAKRHFYSSKIGAVWQIGQETT